MSSMNRFIFEKFKIFYSIICLNAIDMMYNFIFFQISFKERFHNKTMLKNIIFIRKRMVVNSYANISKACFILSAFPIRIFFFLDLRDSFSFIPCNLKPFFVFIPWRQTFPRVEIPKAIRINGINTNIEKIGYFLIWPFFLIKESFECFVFNFFSHHYKYTTFTNLCQATASYA